MILGKSVENVLQIEFHSPRVYTRAIAFSFFFSPPHRNLFFTEFLEQFVTIPPVLSPVCNIDIFPTGLEFSMFFRRGNARFEDSLFIYLPGEVLITESIIIIAIFQDLPHRSVISSFYSLRSITEKLIDIRYFFFFGLSCSPRRTPPYIPCVRFMTLLFFTSIGPITTRKPTSAIQRLDQHLYEEM